LLLQNNGEYDKAMDDYQTILKIDPRYSEAYYNMGFIELAFKNDYQSAIKQFTYAIKANEMYAEAFYNRGICYELLNDTASAIKDYREALNIFPGFELAKEKMKRFRK